MKVIDFLKAVQVFDPPQLSIVSKSLQDYKNFLPDLNLEDPIIKRQI